MIIGETSGLFLLSDFRYKLTRLSNISLGFNDNDKSNDNNTNLSKYLH